MPKIHVYSPLRGNGSFKARGELIDLLLLMPLLKIQVETLYIMLFCQDLTLRYAVRVLPMN